MGVYRFSIGQRFRWENITYEITHILPTHRVNLADLQTGEVMTTDIQVLVTALFDGRLRFAIKDAPKPEGNEVFISHEFVTLADCSPRQQQIARYRYWVIEPLMAVGKKNRTRLLVGKRVEEVLDLQTRDAIPTALRDDLESRTYPQLSVATIYRWIQLFEAGGYDIRALIPHSHKQGRRKYTHPLVEEVMDATIQELYLKRESCRKKDVYLETQLRVDEKNSAGDITELLKPPSYATVSRRIHELDAEAWYRAKYGKRAADAKFAQFEKTPLPTRPLVRVEIDHTRLDLILIDTADELPLGRPTLTTVIDTATRYPLGYYLGFEPASYLSVMEALSHAFRPKQNVREQYGTAHEWLAYGLPRTLVVDGGKEFRGRDLKDACLQLGIHLELAPKYAPEFKAVVERFFGTTNTGLIHTLDGTTFSNIFQRGDYESLKAAKLSLHDVDKIMHIFLLDYYAEEFHEGLQGIPARRWETFVQDGFTPRLPANIDELEILLGRTEERTIFNYGINLFGIRYNATALASVRTQLKEGEKVKVKYHPADISRIYVYDPFGNRYVEVPATEPEYVQGLSLWKHRVIRNFLLREQDSVDEAGLAWAKRKIRQIVAEAKARSKGSTTRKRIARYETNGRSAQNLPVRPAENLSPSHPLVTDEVTESNQPIAPSPTPQQLQKLSNLRLTFDPKELEAEGWGVIHHRD